MYSFLNDYSEGAHPKVLKALIETNDEQSVGYGMDDYCQKAKAVIQERINNQNADVHFLVGGTQVNLTFISYVLKDYQAVIATDEGHIHVHEAGSIEGTGHKVLVAPHHFGKLTVENIEKIVKSHTDEHMVQPKMVYISQTTELGTYYTKDELEKIYAYTKKNGLYLFMDGARLGSALVQNDAPSLVDIAKNTDAFYIGGTKMGALFGEALVIVNPLLQSDFRYQMKQKGSILAKGRLLGVQFYTLLKNRLYEEIGEYENQLAISIRKAFEEKNFNVFCPSSTNQVFVDISKEALNEIEKEFMVTHIKEIKDNVIRIRIVTSWATSQEQVRKLVHLIHQL